MCLVHPLNKVPYSKLDSKSVGIREGVIFLTYSSLIASSEKGRSRLQQLVQWCGIGYDGLVIFDEVYHNLLQHCSFDSLIFSFQASCLLSSCPFLQCSVTKLKI